MQQNSLFDAPQTPECIMLGNGSQLHYQPRWLDQALPEYAVTQFVENYPWQQPTIVIAGQPVPIPRLQCWFADPGACLRYSGRLFKPNPWTPELSSLKAMLEQTLEAPFNSVLVNLYRDGNDSVGWHADDEEELGKTPLIASVSLGQRRPFLLKPKRAHTQETPSVTGKRVSLDLGEGDLLVMNGNTQLHWLHSLPKTRTTSEMRINLTFRNVVKLT